MVTVDLVQFALEFGGDDAVQSSQRLRHCQRNLPGFANGDFFVWQQTMQRENIEMVAGQIQFIICQWAIGRISGRRTVVRA